jgi:hypothetical protein
MTSEACKTIPPVLAEGYENKGSWGEVAGLKTCTSFLLYSLAVLLLLRFYPFTLQLLFPSSDTNNTNKQTSQAPQPQPKP